MARPRLQVWLHETHVADLSGTRTGAVDCRYTAEALDRWDLNVPLLSCSMPLRTGKQAAARTFFRGLLPEGEARNAMAALAGVPVTDTVGMLARFGRDIAGALVVIPEGSDRATRAASLAPYDEAGLAAEVAALAERPLALYDDSELSLAGLQDKLLLVRTPDGWARPRHGHPSTHLLKLEDRRFPGMALLERDALRLAAAVGLTSVDAEVLDVGGLACLVVERFDRTPSPSGGLRRVHQEDVCQALGVDADAARGRGKYETAGGPTWADVAALLRRHAANPDAQLDRLLAAAVFTVVIGNADAHGKNLALLHPQPGVVELAPLYDLVPTALFPTLREDAAMLVNGKLSLTRVTGADLVAEAVGWGVPAARAAEVVEQSAARLRAAAVALDIDERLASLVTRRADAVLASPRRLPDALPARSKLRRGAGTHAAPAA